MTMQATRNLRSRPLVSLPLAGLVAWALAIALLPVEPEEAFLILAPLVIVPLAMRLVDDDLDAPTIPARLLRAARRILFPAALLLACGFAAPPGLAAAWTAAPWLACTLLCAAAGAVRLCDPNRLRRPEQWTIDAGLALLAVGGVAALLARWGVRLLDFSEGIILLTGVHFHYAGFALPVLTSRAIAARPGRLATWTAVAVVALVPLVGLGITFSPLLELVAALGLVLACLAVAGLQFGAADDCPAPLAWTLLVVSSLSLAAGMSVAAVYAVGEYRSTAGIDAGPKPIDIPAMVPLHGALNGIGFALCGLLAWNLAIEKDGQGASSRSRIASRSARPVSPLMSRLMDQCVIGSRSVSSTPSSRPRSTETAPSPFPCTGSSRPSKKPSTRG
ncbi:MAG: YndJ family transporter [Planctomycetales bacterium]